MFPYTVKYTESESDIQNINLGVRVGAGTSRRAAQAEERCGPHIYTIYVYNVYIVYTCVYRMFIYDIRIYKIYKKYEIYKINNIEKNILFLKCFFLF